MPGKHRFVSATVTILLVLTFSAMWTVPVLADDSVPPEDTPTESTPPVDTPTETASPQEENTQAVPSEDEQPTSEDAAPEETSIEEILDAIPDDTQLVILDEDGEALPLASQEAQEAILFKDPVWCPTGVAPKPNVGGCSASFPSLSALVASFTPPTHGTIWIESGNDSGAQVVIDGATNWASAVNFNLTLQGGWNGLPGSMAIVGVSVFDTAISIVNWNGIVTINDISIIGTQNTAYNLTGALNVETKKNIVLSNVTVVNTNYSLTSGAYLNNANSTIQATVTVRNSSFNNNTSYGGLTIFSKGAVTLTNVNASNNFSFGVAIDNSFDLAASPVTITNSFFNGNDGYGLRLYSNGAVKLSQVTASNNTDRGVFVDNTDAVNAPVTVAGFLTAFDNDGSGLEIQSKGLVSLANLTANRNGGAGVIINNSWASAAAPAAVIITGTNVFNDNAYNGLHFATRGAVTLYNITAMRNGLPTDSAGVYFYNNFDPAKPQNVTLYGFNYFLRNGNHGLQIVSYGAITVNNITAIDNGNAINDDYGSGVYLNNFIGTLARPITVNGTSFFAYNDEAGLIADSRGVITVSNVTVTGNGWGATLNNSFGTSAGVVLKGTNSFNRNAGSGLYIYSKGAITLNNVTASYNGGLGVFLFNAYGTLQSPVFVNGYGLFEWNFHNGLHVESNGTITVRNLSANHNLGNGAYLWTKGILAPQAVILNGNNNFNFNGNAGAGHGLVVNSDGAIRLNNVNASYNYYRGAYLNNYTNWSAGAFSTFGSVILSGFGIFNGNGDDGLSIFTHGGVTLNYVTSSFNGEDGIEIDADGNVTLVCSSANNNLWGLFMYGGPVPVLTLRGFYAIGNTANEFLNYVTLIRTRCP